MVTALAALTSTVLHVVPVGVYHSIESVSNSFNGVTTAPAACFAVSLVTLIRLLLVVSCACALTAPTRRSAVTVLRIFLFMGSPRAAVMSESASLRMRGSASQSACADRLFSAKKSQILETSSVSLGLVAERVIWVTLLQVPAG